MARKKKRPTRRPKATRKGKRLFWRVVIIAALLGLTVLALDVWRLTINIEERFAGRRWNIPSRVYSDMTLIYPGQELSTRQLRDRLNSLQYRPSSNHLEQKGSYRSSPNGAVIYLRDLNIPSRQRPGFPVEISISGKTVSSIRRLDKPQNLALLELEPVEIAQFFGPQRESRHLVSLKNLPLHLTQAVLAAEDEDFYAHYGVDPLGILRAIWINLRQGKLRQGGSTLTQQLAKNYFLTPERTWSRKLRELEIALILEAKYDKNTILEIYLNEIYLGQKGSVSVNGMGEAAWFYFNKEARNLSLPESATLAGLIKSPNRYSPYRNLKRSQQRRDQILRAMRENGFISWTQLKTALKTPLQPGTFQAYRRQAPYFTSFLSKQLQELYPKEVLTSQGLSIYTTLDALVQKEAEEALKRGLILLEKQHSALRSKDSKKKLQGAVIVMQPKTGNILALVGGRDFGSSQFNRATQARRQPGSVFKPFVYLAALDSFTPVSLLENRERTYTVNGKPWRPQNYDRKQSEPVRLRYALAHSLNLATVGLALQVGLPRVAAVARGFGFSSPLQPYPSLALGAFEVMPLEMARAYCALAGGGVLPYPLSLREVTDDKGLVKHRRHMEIQGVTTPAKAYMISSLLRSAVLEGTGRSLARRGINFPLAGKTGTSNDFRDAWFVGYTPEILALVWVGFDDGRSLELSGAQAALPIWADLINNISWQISGRWFRQPSGIVKVDVCRQSNQWATGRCPHRLQDIFLSRTPPSGPCPLHPESGIRVRDRSAGGFSNDRNKDLP